MVKTLGLAFALLLAYTHMANVQGDAYHRPLSLFRDYSPAWIGYALFVVLLAIGLEIARTAYRVGAKFRAVVYLVATGLLGVVAATPSQGDLHTVLPKRRRGRIEAKRVRVRIGRRRAD